MSDIIPANELAQIKTIAADAFESRLLSPEIRNAQAAFFVAAVGAELGLSPIQSLQNIYVIKGKAILSSHAILAIVMRRRDTCKYFRLVESTAERATYETMRDGHPSPSTLTFTIEDAKRANLLNNPTWKSHPAAMLRARCGTSLARAVYPDLVLGLYNEDEGEEIRGSDDYARRLPAAEPAPIDSSRVPPQLPAANPEPTGAFAPTEEERTKARIAELSAKLTAAESIAELDSLRVAITNEPEAVRAPLREIYTKRKDAIHAANGVAS